MDKLEAVQRVMRFSNKIREWCTDEHSVYFDDFDPYNVDDYEEGGFGELADEIIVQGIKESIIDEDDLD